MKYISTTILLLLALFLPLPSFSQTNFKPGFIVNSTGDTINGYINIKEWKHNPTSINFKSPSGETSQKTTDQIGYFEVSGISAYKKYTVNITTAGTDISNLSEAVDTTYVTKSVFLKIVQKGSHITLLSYSDKIKNRFYILENNQLKPAELIYRSYYSPEGSTIKNSNNFRNQLFVAAEKYTEVDNKFKRILEGTAYTQDGIVSTINKINNVPTLKKKSGSRLFIGISMNRNFSSIEPFQTNVRSSKTSYKASTFYTPQISLGLDFFNNPVVKKIIIRQELSFSHSKQSFKGVLFNGTEDIYSFSLYTATLTPQLLYNFYNKENLKIYFGGGFSLNYYPKTEITSEILYSPIIKEWYKIDPISFSIPVEAGIALNQRVEMSLKYIHPIPVMDRSGTFRSSTETFNLGAYWLLRKKSK